MHQLWIWTTPVKNLFRRWEGDKSLSTHSAPDDDKPISQEAQQKSCFNLDFPEFNETALPVANKEKNNKKAVGMPSLDSTHFNKNTDMTADSLR